MKQGETSATFASATRELSGFRSRMSQVVESRFLDPVSPVAEPRRVTFPEGWPAPAI